jgi:hypothetical protein
MSTPPGRVRCVIYDNGNRVRGWIDTNADQFEGWVSDAQGRQVGHVHSGAIYEGPEFHRQIGYAETPADAFGRVSRWTQVGVIGGPIVGSVNKQGTLFRLDPQTQQWVQVGRAQPYTAEFLMTGAALLLGLLG